MESKQPVAPLLCCAQSIEGPSIRPGVFVNGPGLRGFGIAVGTDHGNSNIAPGIVKTFDEKNNFVFLTQQKECFLKN